MPRVGKPENSSQRERMRRYRDRQRQVRRPEGSAVDVAVATAVAAYSARAAADPTMDVEVLKALLDDAVDRLGAEGYSRKQARRKVISRIGRFSCTVPGERSSQ